MTQSTTGLVEKLLLSADAGDYGRKPDPTDVRRQAATLLSTQETTIAELVAALEKARAEALEEAAQEADRIAYEQRLNRAIDGKDSGGIVAAGYVANAIRALTKSRSAL